MKIQQQFLPQIRNCLQFPCPLFLPWAIFPAVGCKRVIIFPDGISFHISFSASVYEFPPLNRPGVWISHHAEEEYHIRRCKTTSIHPLKAFKYSHSFPECCCATFVVWHVWESCELVFLSITPRGSGTERLVHGGEILTKSHSTTNDPCRDKKATHAHIHLELGSPWVVKD